MAMQAHELLTMDKIKLAELDAVMLLQDQVMQALPDPLWYLPSTREEHGDTINRGNLLGCYLQETPESEALLVGFAAFARGEDRGKGAYAKKLGEPVPHSFDVHDAMVHPDFRRRGILSAFLSIFAENARLLDARVLYATIAPENQASVKCFEKAGYTYIKTQPAYDGRLRKFYRKDIV